MRSSSSMEKSMRTEHPKSKSPEMLNELQEHISLISHAIKEISFRNREDKKRENRENNSKWKWLNDFL